MRSTLYRMAVVLACYLNLAAETKHTDVARSNILYHGSPQQGLKEIKPNESTHGKKWVYATTHLSVAAAYLGRWGDFDFAQGACGLNAKWHLVERYPGAFEKVYGKGLGSVYKLDAKGFREGETSFPGEVVKDSPAVVIEETKVDQPLLFLKDLASKGDLELYTYPSRPSCIPSDDSDLIKNAVEYIKGGSKGIKELFLKKHPQLKERLEAELTKP